MLCIHSFELFFFWRKCSTVVAVPLKTGINLRANVFFAFRKKCDRKKRQQGGLCGSRQKDRASPEVRGAGIFGGWGF